jgi:hypothetical protein
VGGRGGDDELGAFCGGGALRRSGVRMFKGVSNARGGAPGATGQPTRSAPTSMRVTGAVSREEITPEGPAG